MFIQCFVSHQGQITSAGIIVTMDAALPCLVDTGEAEKHLLR